MMGLEISRRRSLIALRCICLIGLALCFGVNLYVAFDSGWIGFDASLFWSQIHRVITPEAGYPFEAGRPRGLIIVLSLLFGLVKKVTGASPSITHLRVAMAFLTAASLMSSYCLFRRLVNLRTTLVATLILLTNYLYFEMGNDLLADIATSLFLNLFLIVYFRRVQRGGALGVGDWLALGSLGGFAAMFKFPYFFFPLFFVGCLWIAGRIWEGRGRITLAQLGWFALSFFLTVDILQRLFGELSGGLYTYLELYVQYGLILVGLHPKYQGHKVFPFNTYVRFFLESWGVWIALALYLTISRRGLRAKLRLSPDLIPLAVSALVFGLFHQMIRAREPRYLFPLLPIVALGLGSVIAPSLWRRGRFQLRFAVPCLFAIGMGCFFAVSKLEAQRLVNQDPSVPEFERLVRTLGMSGQDGRRCRYLYLCEFETVTIRFDIGTATARVPGLVAKNRFCATTPTLAGFQAEALHPVLEDLTDDACFLVGKSFSFPSPTERYVLYRPVQTGPNEGEKECVQRNGESRCYEKLAFF